MKTFKSIIFSTTTLLFIFACGDKTSQTMTSIDKKSYSSFEVNMSSKDTINRTDAQGNKQGNWILFGKTMQAPGFKDDQMVEEGLYVNNKKAGVWKRYFSSGNLSKTVTYDSGLPNGYAIFYNEKRKNSR